MIKKILLLSVVLAVGACARSKDVSERQLEPKLAACLAGHSIGDVAHGPAQEKAKRCVLHAVYAQKKPDEDIRSRLSRLGFDCGTDAAAKCVLTSRQRQYSTGLLTPDYQHWVEYDAAVYMTTVGDRITSLSIEEQDISSDGKINGPYQTDGSIL